MERFKARSEASELKSKQSLAKLIKRVRRPLGKLTLVFVLLVMLITELFLNVVLTIEKYLKEIYQVLKPPSRKKQPQKKNNYRQQKKGLK